MGIRIAIMGFGRMGRNIFRLLYPRDDIEVVAIDDIAAPEAMEYLLRYDSRLGPLEDPVELTDGYLYVKGRRIKIMHQAEPGEIPWYDLGVDVVVEATGRYRGREDLQKHLEAGASRVVLTTPPRDDIDCLQISGVSEGAIAREHRLISCGSSTSNCLAVMLKTLDDAFGVEEGCFTAVHAYTAEQSLIDVPSSINLRLSRAAVENIVPVHSWAAQGIQRLFPKLEGKFTGRKLNVPVPDVSCVDLVTTLSETVKPEEVNAVFRSAAGSGMKHYLQISDDPIVSSDVVGSSASCVFDSLTTMVVEDRMVKTLGWYEQGGGLAHRIVEVIGQLAPTEVTS